jgi:hypothetical protein
MKADKIVKNGKNELREKALCRAAICDRIIRYSPVGKNGWSAVLIDRQGMNIYAEGRIDYGFIEKY